MAKNTEEIGEKKKEKKLDKKTPKKDIKKVTPKAKKEKEREIENKSIQNKVIENIKTFISKILELQEKVKKEEELEKKEEKKEKKEKNNINEEDNQPKYLLEYYDLPYRYNETVVKILAQTPKRLFVYWDVSDKDKATYLNAFGENFFKDTYPVLLLHNEDKNYTQEITINDFANSWYLDISDSRDKYTIQLGRKFKSYIKPQINSEIEKTNIDFNNDYLLIAISNKLEVPNDHILLEEFKPYVKYRDIKTKKEEVKTLNSSVYKNKLQHLYQALYQDNEIMGDKFDFSNPSSMGTSSMVAK